MPTGLGISIGGLRREISVIDIRHMTPNSGEDIENGVEMRKGSISKQ